MDTNSFTKAQKDSASSTSSLRKSKISSSIMSELNNPGIDFATRFLEQEEAVASVDCNRLSNIIVAADRLEDSTTELSGLILLANFLAENKDETLDWLKNQSEVSAKIVEKIMRMLFKTEDPRELVNT